MKEALDIHVEGIVQGVGFRPFVYKLARRYLITGWVLNAVDGVTIHAEGEEDLVSQFVMEISENAPQAAHVERITMKEVPLQDCEKFEIRFSDDDAVERTTLVSPDLATCDDCLRELFDPADRRYRYPFINCTNCGPRYTILDKLPYDRANTSMSVFPMCDECAREYADVANRRFHAQPDACFECGPHVFWATGADDIFWGDTRAHSDKVFAQAVRVIAAGGIVAVKGLGGFHLVCDARNEAALATLRARKHRDNKAFAVMVSSVAAARRLCLVDEVEEKLLQSPARPIVLLRKRADAQFAKGLADKLPELGVMLAATPVQHLLMNDFLEATGNDMLVMTSGNLHDEPIVCDDAEAFEKLGGIADGFLGNNRAIRARYDDSVVRVISVGAGNQAIQFIRRARGFAPRPLDYALGKDSRGEGACDGCTDDARVFAAGPEQKNTFALVRGTEAFVSQHIGDLENAETYDAWLDAKKRFETLFDAAPTVVACDRHPEYLASKWAHEQDLPLVEVQHHHAHIASVLGEQGLFGPVCGVAFDGTGYGMDGAIWGGEVLIANRQDFERFANFTYVPMPGGAAAIKEPLRMAFGVLWAYDLLDHPQARSALGELYASGTADVCAQMIDKSLNCPYTSSVGRLFDAASALLGVCAHPTYEGEAAILLDAARDDTEAAEPDEAARARYAVSVVKNTATKQSTAHDTSVVLFDAASTFAALLDDMQAGVDTGVISRRFHDAMAEAVVTAARLVQAVYGITTVALSGGVFMNRFMVEQATRRLGAAGFTVALNGNLPPNDGCISYGQAVVACATR